MMRRLLFAPLLLVLSGCNSAPPGIDQKAHNTCLKAADYMGCIEMMSGNKNKIDSKICTDLKQALAIVRERLVSGTSLTKLDINTNPLSDALAIAKVKPSEATSCSRLVADSQAILEMIRILRNQWSVEIDIGVVSQRQGGIKIWPSPKIELNILKFNDLAGGDQPAISGPGKITGLSDKARQNLDYEMREWKGGLLFPCGVYHCGNYVVKSPLSRMFDVIGLKIEEAIEGKGVNGLSDPEEIQKRLEEGLKNQDKEG